MFTDLWQWLLETLDLLRMDKTDYPLLTVILVGRIALVCAVFCLTLVVWVYAPKVADWIKARSHRKGDT